MCDSTKRKTGISYNYQIPAEKEEAYVISSEDQVLLLALKHYRNDWEYWETVIHEVSHIVHNISRRHGFEDETEAKAYLSEYLFKEIRKGLTGVKNLKNVLRNKRK